MSFYLTADRMQGIDPMESRGSSPDRALGGRWIGFSGAPITIFMGRRILLCESISDLLAERFQFAHQAGVSRSYSEVQVLWPIDAPKVWLSSGSIDVGC